jgi:serine/threonine protein kinase
MSASSPVFSAGMRIGRYEIRRHIAKGGYGDLYSGIDADTQEDVAIKIEFLGSDQHGILGEADVLRSVQPSAYFPRLISSGATEGFRYIAVSLLGPSLLAVCRALPANHCSLYTTLHLAVEMLTCIESFHSFGYVHRDIKLANFLLRADVRRPVVLTDFGLSRPFLVNGCHIERGRSDGLVGTCLYASVNAHDQKQLVRRDDLISWFYCVVELAQGSLPWSHLTVPSQIRRVKKSVAASELCKGLPPGFQAIWKHLKRLRFEDKPNYGMIRRVIRVAISKQIHNDREWDWEKLDDDVKAEISQTQLPVWEDAEERILDEGYCSCPVA